MPQFLVIGCGSIGKRHLRNLLHLGVRDLLAYDPREDRRKEVVGELGVAVTADLDGAYDSGVGVAYVCSPPSLHVTQALQAAKFGCHLFIEKPLADSLAGVEQLLATIKERRLISLVGCNFRFHPGLQGAKALMREGVIGRALFARAQFGQYLPDWHPWEDYRQGYSAQRHLGGGVVLDRIHELDYLRWLLGEVDSISGFVGKVSRLETDTEDLAELILRFQSGAVASIHVDYLRRTYECSCEIVGEDGTIEWSFQDHSVRWYRAAEKCWHARQWVNYDVNTMYVEQTRHFLACLRGEAQSACDASDGSRVLALALQARGS